MTRMKIGSVSVSAGEVKNINYYYLTNRTGAISVKAVLIGNNIGGDVQIIKSINIDPHGIK